MKAGLFSIGLDTYWPQFDGLLDNLTGYHAEIRERIADMGIELVDAGMVDSVEFPRVASDWSPCRSITASRGKGCPFR